MKYKLAKHLYDDESNIVLLPNDDVLGGLACVFTCTSEDNAKKLQVKKVTNSLFFVFAESFNQLTVFPLRKDCSTSE